MTDQLRGYFTALRAETCRHSSRGSAFLSSGLPATSMPAEL